MALKGNEKPGFTTADIDLSFKDSDEGDQPDFKYKEVNLGWNSTGTMLAVSTSYENVRDSSFLERWQSSMSLETDS
jgi:hypothetical protein